MIGTGHIIGHRDWAPSRKSDPGPFLVDEIRNWAPTGAPPTQEDDMPTIKELNDGARRGELADLVEAIANRTTTKVRDVAGLAKADQIVNVLSQLTTRIDSGSLGLAQGVGLAGAGP